MYIMLFSVIFWSLVINLALDGQQLDIDTILLALCCSLAVEVYIQLLYLRHCVTSLLRIRFRNSGVQDNVYVIVAYFFVEPVTQLYISHIQEQNNLVYKNRT